MNAKTVGTFNFIRAIVVFSLVLVIGIAFLVFFLFFNKPIPENYVETNAKIIRIEEELSPTYDESDGINDDDYEHRVFVEYSYNDKTYTEKEYGNYNSNMKVGDTVIVYVNPDDPEEFMSDPSGSTIFIIVGIIVILVGLGGLVFNFLKKKKGA